MPARKRGWMVFVIVSLLQGPLFAGKPVHTAYWSKVSIPFDELKSFSELSIEQMIEAFRGNPDFRTLVIGSNPQKNIELNPNYSADILDWYKQFVEWFYAIKHKELNAPANGSFPGMLLRPDEMRFVQPDRPYINEAVLVIRPSLNRLVYLQEFTHYLIWKALNKPNAPSPMPLPEGKSETDFDVVLGFLDYQENFTQNEADVIFELVSHAGELNLSRAEIKDQLDYMTQRLAILKAHLDKTEAEPTFKQAKKSKDRSEEFLQVKARIQGLRNKISTTEFDLGYRYRLLAEGMI